MDVSIIIVNYNTKSLLRDCLVSIYKYTRDIEFEIIVSDNGSSDGSIGMVYDLFPKVILLENKVNLGFGAANNRGLDIAKGKYIFYLNSDTILLNNAIKIFYEYFKNFNGENRIGVLGANLLNKDLRIGYSYSNFFSYKGEILSLIKMYISCICQILFKLFIGHYYAREVRINPVYGQVDVIIGAAMFMKNDKFARFDERFFMFHEETDMQLQKKYNKYFSVLINGPKIIHLGGGSSGADNDYLSKITRKTMFYNFCSIIIYFKKNKNSKIFVSIMKILIIVFYLNPCIIRHTHRYAKDIFHIK
jgi:GT2 family glycosyltransferase